MPTKNPILTALNRHAFLILVALIALVALLAAFVVPTPGHAQNTTLSPPTRIISNVRHMGHLDSTAGQTFATTSYADLVGTVLTFTPSRSPTAVGPTPPVYRTVRVRILYNMDVTKATATTGSCAVYVNGAIVAASERFISSAAARGNLGGTFTYPLTTNGAQVVKLQCRSGDTNVFTVSNAQVSYDEIF